MSKSFTKDYTNGAIKGALLRFSFPLFLANLFQVAYNMADMIIVGKVCGQVGLSACSIGGEVSEFFTFIVIGFSYAAQVIISQFFGAGQIKRISRFVGTFVITICAFGVFNTVIALVLRKPLLIWLNTPDTVMDGAMIYSLISIIGIIFVFGYNAVSALMRGLGDSKRPFIFIAGAATLNIILDLILVLGCGLGPMGAAIATVVSQAVSFLVSLIYLIIKRERLGFELHFSDIRMDWSDCAALIKLGIPMALKSGAVTISTLFINSYLYSYGVGVTAITGIGNKFNMVGRVFANSLDTAGSTIVGQNIGAKKYSRVSKTIFAVTAFSVISNSILSVILLLFPESIYGLFTSKDLYAVDPDVGKTLMVLALEYVPVAVIRFMASALRSGTNSLINGSGSALTNLIVAILDAVVVRIGLCMLFGQALGMGYQGFWYGNAISAFTPLVIGIIYYVTGKWKSEKFTA